MRTWFERDVHGRSASVLTARRDVTKRFDFCVRKAGAMVIPLADRAAVANDNGADRRVRRRRSKRASRELDCTREIDAVGRRSYRETSTPFQNAT